MENEAAIPTALFIGMSASGKSTVCSMCLIGDVCRGLNTTPHGDEIEVGDGARGTTFECSYYQGTLWLGLYDGVTTGPDTT